MDIDRVKAEEVVDALRDNHDASVDLFWDRGPYCVRLFLAPAEKGTGDCSPALFFWVEDSDSYKIADGRGWEWHGVIAPDEDQEHENISFRIIERTWLGDNETSVAADMMRLAHLLA